TDAEQPQNAASLHVNHFASRRIEDCHNTLPLIQIVRTGRERRTYQGKNASAGLSASLSLHDAVQRTKADTQFGARGRVRVEPVLRREIFASKNSSAPAAGPAKYGKRIVGAEQEPVVQIGMTTQPE